MKKIIIKKTVLQKLYIKEHKTIEEISKILLVDHRIIKRNLDENKIEIRRKKKRISKKTIINLYIKKKLSIRKISTRLNKSEGVVRASLVEYGIKRRNRKEQMEHLKTGKIVLCEKCKKKIYRKGYRLKRYSIFFCSWECSKKYQSTLKKSKLGKNWRRGRFYKKWRKEVFERDSYSCKLCRSTDLLTAHHIIEAQDNPKIKFDTSNGICLCKKCHTEIHKNNSKNYIKSLQEAILVA